MDEPIRRARCCVVGGGPAGVMLGFLLARAGIETIVLEKHADFFRDFRGDTIHPSTMTLMSELGLLDDFLKIKHSEIRQIGASIGGEYLRIGDFQHVPGPSKYIALMPQWDFLNFLAAAGKKYPAFHLEMNADAFDVTRDGARITGVRAKSPAGAFTVEADLVVAADGRSSTIRERSGLTVRNMGAPIDVLWLRLSKKPNDPPQALGNVTSGGFLVAIDRTDYFQIAYVIHKGGDAEVRAAGIEAFRARIADAAPFLGDRVGELTSWDDVKLLSVAVNRLDNWSLPGLLCIGDAAHAMSPIGGVGINLAVQDAVAAANILAAPLGTPAPLAPAILQRVQRRREFPMRVIQRIQVTIQNAVLQPILNARKSIRAPWPLRVINAIPLLQRIPAYIVGVGVRPEHIRTPEVLPVAGKEAAAPSS